MKGQRDQGVSLRWYKPGTLGQVRSGRGFPLRLGLGNGRGQVGEFFQRIVLQPADVEVHLVALDQLVLGSCGWRDPRTKQESRRGAGCLLPSPLRGSRASAPGDPQLSLSATLLRRSAATNGGTGSPFSGAVARCALQRRVIAGTIDTAWSALRLRRSPPSITSIVVLFETSPSIVMSWTEIFLTDFHSSGSCHDRSV